MITRRLYTIIEKLQRGFANEKKFAVELLQTLIQEFSIEIHIASGRVWERVATGYRCIHEEKTRRKLPPDFIFPFSQVPIEEMRTHRFIAMARGNPQFDVPAQRYLEESNFTAFPVDKDGNYVVSMYFRSNEDFCRDKAHIESFLKVIAVFTTQLWEKRDENKMLSEILDLARNQQISILPSVMPTFAGYDIAGISIPFTVVGGDYFNFYPLYGPLLGVVIADVKGKGFNAALQATALHRVLLVLRSTNLKIAYKADIINKAFYDEGFNENIIAMVYGELGLDGRFNYTNLAHIYPLVYRNIKDDFLELDEGGTFLGLQENAMFGTGIVLLKPGDILLMYTDGITETLNESEEEYGRERLKKLLRRMRRRKAQEIVDAILDESEKFARTEAGITDDRTVVVIKRLIS